MIAALLVAALAAGAMVWGFRLQPDSAFYAAGNLAVHDSLLAGVAGRLGGMPALIVASALGVALSVLLVRRRYLFAALAFVWLIFPGADAIGTAAVLLAARAATTRGRLAISPLAFLAHPVALLTAGPTLLLGRRRGLFVGGALLLGVCSVFLLDGERAGTGVSAGRHALYLTRYALPLLAVSL